MSKIHGWGNTILIVVAILLGLVGGNQLNGIGGSTAATFTAGNLVSNGTLTVTGATTFTATSTASNDLIVSGNLGVGTTTPSDIGHVENSSATSTLIISSGGSAVGGRIIIEDHDGAGCSEIAILNGTVAAKTVTCPTGI